MNCRVLLSFVILTIAGHIGCGRASAQVILGQTDDFQDGTVLNWTNGPFAADPMNIPTNGPAGAGDRFMQIATNGAGGGAGSRMTVYNRNQWLGDYVDQGITAIEADLKVFGPKTLSMRLGFRGGLPNGSPGFVSTTAFAVPADNAWHHALFYIDSANMTEVGAAGSYSSFFTSGIVEFRFLHLPNLTGTTSDLDGSTTFPDPMMLGIDNIHAIAVPEPAPLALLSVNGSVIAFLLRRRRMNSTNHSRTKTSPAEAGI